MKIIDRTELVQHNGNIYERVEGENPTWWIRDKEAPSIYNFVTHEEAMELERHYSDAEMDC